VSLPEFSAETLGKARRARQLGLVRQDEEHRHVWWVNSLRAGGGRYRVQEDVECVQGEVVLTWVTCTCPHGLNIGAGQASCYHVAAVLLGYLEAPGQ
jgi:hypothetical protein